jgi:hypothetical protein
MVCAIELRECELVMIPIDIVHDEHHALAGQAAPSHIRTLHGQTHATMAPRSS